MAKKTIKISNALDILSNVIEPSITVIEGTVEGVVELQLELGVNLPDIITGNEAPASGLFNRESARLLFAGCAVAGLMVKNGDVGGRNDERIVTEAYRLADLMVEKHFDT